MGAQSRPLIEKSKRLGRYLDLSRTEFSESSPLHLLELVWPNAGFFCIAGLRNWKTGRLCSLLAKDLSLKLNLKKMRNAKLELAGSKKTKLLKSIIWLQFVTH